MGLQGELEVGHVIQTVFPGQMFLVLPLLAQVVVLELSLGQEWWHEGLAAFLVALVKRELLRYTFFFGCESRHFYFVEIF